MSTSKPTIKTTHPKVLHYWYKLHQLDRLYTKQDTDVLQALHAIEAMKSHWRKAQQRMPESVRHEASARVNNAIAERDSTRKQMQDMCRAFTGSTVKLQGQIDRVRTLTIKALDTYEARLRELGIDPNSTPEPDNDTTADERKT